jgi:hypothetical protein
LRWFSPHKSINRKPAFIISATYIFKNAIYTQRRRVALEGFSDNFIQILHLPCGSYIPATKSIDQDKTSNATTKFKNIFFRALDAIKLPQTPEATSTQRYNKVRSRWFPPHKKTREPANDTSLIFFCDN